MSIDDFYLKGEDQEKLANMYPNNPLLQYRSNAGTHDIELGEKTLIDLQNAKTGDTVKIPIFDKSLRNGRGDRLDSSEWRTMEGPVDVIIIEGWMLGFTPVPKEILVSEPIIHINEFMSSYERWHSLIDYWLAIQTDSLNNVYEWRQEQEKKMISEGKTGMSDTELLDFISRFMPAYETYLPIRSDLSVTVNINRFPIIEE
eukprot:GHVL01037427.1.p1 GENE.GHVL01037427.1~~GHVL01037427.1.p1  ORF type:complete len:201 (-),score=41.91 GHVL01037427.1:42-644(-)